MLSPDFYGRKGFIWWTGVVEDVKDPLKIGHVRVRIIGLHSEDRTVVPTEKLPWAQVMLSPNESRTTSSPRAGDWVFGFFQDGEQAQIPVVMGVFPGIESVQSQTTYAHYASKVNRQPLPAPPENQPVREVLNPTTHRLSRGIVEKTGIEFTNNRLAHSCGLSDAAAAAWATAKARLIAEIIAVRVALEALYKGESLYPWLQNILEVVRTIRKYLQIIQKVIQFVKDVVLAIAAFIQYIRDMIAWILSLPEKIAQIVRNCMKALFAEIKDVLSAFDGGPDNAGLGALVSEVNGLYNDGLKVVRDGASTVILGTALLKSSATIGGGNAANFDAKGIDNFATLADNISLSANNLKNSVGNSDSLGGRNGP